MPPVRSLQFKNEFKILQKKMKIIRLKNGYLLQARALSGRRVSQKDAFSMEK